MSETNTNVKIISCKKCGQKIRIPADKHIRFVCPNSTCRSKYEYKNGKPVIKLGSDYWFPISALVTALIGSFYTYLFPIPLLVGMAWFGWWGFRQSNKILAMKISGVLSSTAIGLSLLFTLQLILNFGYQTNSVKIPKWLLLLDDFLVSWREYLSSISDISLFTYILLIAFLLFLAIRKPEWKPLSKFVKLEEWVGRTTVILIVITSFTFFAPSVLEQSLNEAYYKHYKIIVRKKLKQDRKRLIADEIRRQLQANNLTEYAASFPVFSENLNELTIQEIQVSNEAKQDVESIMSSAANLQIAKYFNSSIGWEGSDDYLHENWNKESENWKHAGESAGHKAKQDNNSKVKSDTRELNSVEPANGRKDFIEANIAEMKATKVLADEALEAVKAVFFKLLGGVIPAGDTVFGKYIEEFINAAAEYLFEKVRVPEMVNYFFSTGRNRGRVDVFARIGSFWQTINDVRQEKAEAEMAKKQMELSKIKEVALEKENSSLEKEIAGKTRNLEVEMPDKWQEIKEKLELEQGTSISNESVKSQIIRKAQNDVQTLLIDNNTYLNVKEKNDVLKNNLEVVSRAKSTKDVLAAFRTSSFPLCPICHMPNIPGTSCIVGFR